MNRETARGKYQKVGSMRKALTATVAAVVCLALAVGLLGCSGGKPQGMSQVIYDQGKSVVSITESYLDGSTSALTAMTRIDSCSSKMKDARSSDSTIDQITYLDVVSISLELMFIDTGVSKDNSRIETYLADLKKQLGV